MAADDAVTRCPTCGTEIHRGANFCYACGENTMATVPPPADETASTDQRNAEPHQQRGEPSKRRRWEWWKR